MLSASTERFNTPGLQKEIELAFDLVMMLVITIETEFEDSQ